MTKKVLISLNFHDTALATETLSAAKESDNEYLDALNIAAMEGANLKGLLSWASARGWSSEQIANLKSTYNSAQESFTKKAEEEKAAKINENYLKYLETAGLASTNMDYLLAGANVSGFSQEQTDNLKKAHADAVTAESTSAKKGYLAGIESDLSTVKIADIITDESLTEEDRKEVFETYHKTYANAYFSQSNLTYKEAKWVFQCLYDR